MTLCAAWLNDGELVLASDSKLTGDETTVSEGAPKVFDVRLRIKGASNSERPQDEEPVLYDSCCGICFSGSYLSGSSIADSIGYVLSNLQGAWQISDFSMSNVSEIAFQVYRQVSEQQMQIHNRAGLIKALFTGYCPESRALMLYKFDVEKEGDEIKFRKELISLSDTPVFIGDTFAVNKAEELQRKLSDHYSMFHLLRAVIKDREIDSVGGPIQAGSFKNGEFRLYGLMQYEEEEDDFGFKGVKQNMSFRSFSLDLNDSNLRTGNVNILISLFTPFEQERNQMIKETNEHNLKHTIPEDKLRNE